MFPSHLYLLDVRSDDDHYDFLLKMILVVHRTFSDHSKQQVFHICYDQLNEHEHIGHAQIRTTATE